MLETLIQPDYTTQYYRKMMTIKQKKGESAHSFILNMQALCKRVDKNMNEPTVLTHIREGLDDSLKPQISIKNPRTIEELMIEVQNAERAKKEDPERRDYSNSTKNSMLKMVEALTVVIRKT